jgi:hypothetical protein
MRRALAEGYELDDDPARIDVEYVRRYLAEESYWARGRSPAPRASSASTTASARSASPA